MIDPVENSAGQQEIDPTEQGKFVDKVKKAYTQTGWQNLIAHLDHPEDNSFEVSYKKEVFRVDAFILDGDPSIRPAATSARSTRPAHSLEIPKARTRANGPKNFLRRLQHRRPYSPLSRVQSSQKKFGLLPSLGGLYTPLIYIPPDHLNL